MHVLLKALCDPESLIRIDSEAWNVVLRQSRELGLHARLGQVLKDRGLLLHLPPKAQEQFDDAIVACKFNQTKLLYEIKRLAVTLKAVDGPVVLLKGGAYLAADLPPSRGRIASDLDILVSEKRLASVEAALIADGWEPCKLNEYDQHYYRAWMHELPPLWHPARRAVIDVHHTIMPRTSRVRPNATALIGAAQGLTENRFLVLAPEDMVLHNAVHTIYNGSFASALRDMVDLHELLQHFAAKAGFWKRLVARAQLHGVERALHYALNLASRVLETPIPRSAKSSLMTCSSSFPIDRLVNSLFATAITPEDKESSRVMIRLARFLLQTRSQWLNMPLPLLLRHVSVKASRRCQAFLDPPSESGRWLK